MPPTRHRTWCFTINNYTDEDCKRLDGLLDDGHCRRLIGGLEVGESGTPHVQGAVVWSSAVSFETCKSRIGRRAHLLIAHGSWKSNVTYCSKDHEVKWAKNLKGGQGCRTDWQDGMGAITDGCTLWQIAHDYPALGRCMHAVKTLKEEHDFESAPKWRDVKVHVLYGPTGTGKTRRAVDHDNYFMQRAGEKWWDGYRGEKRLVLDEFRDRCYKPEELIAILDGYKLRLPIKGAHTYARWTEVYITSNVNPEDWYRGTIPETRAAIARRITNVEHMDTPPQPPPSGGE